MSFMVDSAFVAYGTAKAALSHMSGSWRTSLRRTSASMPSRWGDADRRPRILLDAAPEIGEKMWRSRPWVDWARRRTSRRRCSISPPRGGLGDGHGAERRRRRGGLDLADQDAQRPLTARPERASGRFGRCSEAEKSYRTLRVPPRSPWALAWEKAWRSPDQAYDRGRFARCEREALRA